MRPLFRDEAVQAARHSWLGGIQLIRPASVSLLTAFAVAAAVLVLAFLVYGEYTRKARVGGVLVPDLGLIRLVPQEAATVVERLANEGQTVRQGEVLFVLSVDRGIESGDAQAGVRKSLADKQRSLASAVAQQADLLAAQSATLERQIADRRGELVQLESEAALHRQRLALAREALGRLQSLQADNFISSAQVESKSEELLGVQAELQRLERERATQWREIGMLEAQRRELPLRIGVTTGELERDLATVAQQEAEVEARQRLVVRAPSDGVIGSVLAEPGQSVSPSAPLASLIPANARLQAHLYAPSSALGFVRPEQSVLLRYQAFPYQKFGHHTGHVLQVSRTPVQQSEMANVPLAGIAAYSTVSGEPLYRITVALDRQDVAAYGSAQPLVAGMQLEADVLLDRRRLIEWLIEPLLGLSGRVAAAPAESAAPAAPG